MLKLVNVLILFVTFNVAAQQVKKVYDIGGWAGLGVNYKLNKSYTASFLQEVRFYESFSLIEKSISEVGIEYKINKQFKLGGNLRYSYDRGKDMDFSNDFRFNADLKFKRKFGDFFTFKYRLRYQETYEHFFEAVSEGVVANFRNKLAIERKLEKHTVYFCGEIFRERVIYKKAYFNKLRLAIGDRLETGLGQFQYALTYERELSSIYPLNFLFLRVNYLFKMKR